MSIFGTLMFAEPATADVDDECTAQCGPAPCCHILWTTWCGCPWADEQALE
ncbi:hypothetical protein G6O69_14840 [Pseudenhygromyxa sp. WMMC2535]|uniref:hypothetical protein n=1 Tax=Pseudenhygromyxa sp. WMMC2535 TaxID=2712867 RepID=UPI001595DCD5|nr:hypothetical protein [Pseudenhygromyxa sp. WMMC2535]NVB39118.1 hypothetical protein [Pseudenhygromyxa sp. WMMC2535]